MTKEILKFRKALENLKKAETELNAVVSPLMKEASMDTLQNLIDVLPREYNGTRRIYEAMLKLDKNEIP